MRGDLLAAHHRATGLAARGSTGLPRNDFLFPVPAAPGHRFRLDPSHGAEWHRTLGSRLHCDRGDLRSGDRIDLPGGTPGPALDTFHLARTHRAVLRVARMDPAGTRYPVPEAPRLIVDQVIVA